MPYKIDYLIQLLHILFIFLILLLSSQSPSYRLALITFNFVFYLAELFQSDFHFGKRKYKYNFIFPLLHDNISHHVGCETVKQEHS